MDHPFDAGTAVEAVGGHRFGAPLSDRSNAIGEAGSVTLELTAR